MNFDTAFDRICPNRQCTMAFARASAAPSSLAAMRSSFSLSSSDAKELAFDPFLRGASFVRIKSIFGDSTRFFRNHFLITNAMERRRFRALPLVAYALPFIYQRIVQCASIRSHACPESLKSAVGVSIPNLSARRNRKRFTAKAFPFTKAVPIAN